MQLYPEKYEQLELSSSEKSILRILERAFNDDNAYYVLHINPRRKASKNGQPELFNLFIHDKGVLLLQIFDLEDCQIASSIIKSIGSPIVFNCLLSDIKERLGESRYLINSNGELKYGVTICFAFPNIERPSVLEDFEINHVFYKDDIAALRKRNNDILLSRIPQRQTINEDVINCIFQRLCPEITIPRKYIIDDDLHVSITDQQLSVMDKSVLSYRLDSKQIDIVNRIDRGHQLILACAGSGKSVLLISKCFKLASLNPNEDFLITCYNRNLNNYYQWAIAQAGFSNRNVTCSTFYGLCRYLLEKNSLPLPTAYHNQENDYYDRLFGLANAALETGAIKNRYSGIFIDEVQIFRPEWYRFCFNLLKSKEPSEYFFTIAGDKSQDIKNNIRRGKAPWQGGGSQYPEYRGRTLPIEINYRNSKPINDAIDRFVNHAKQFGNTIGVDLSSDPELFLRGTAYRQGNNPSIIELDDYSNEGESNAVCDAVKELIEEKGYSEVDIAIIFYNKYARYTYSGWDTHYYNILPGIKQRFFKEGWEQPAILIYGETEGATYGSRRGVTISTIEGSLGLDFKAVVLAGLRPLGTHEKVRQKSDFVGATGEDLTNKQEAFKKNINFIYTGCTRAKDDLTIILSASKGESMYMDLLRESI